MYRICKSCFLIVGLFSLIGVGVNAATLFVDSLDDGLGSVATLRQTILDASSGDTINFSVSGTIFLDEALGELVVDKELIIDGGNQIVVDGGDLINICFHIANTGTIDASNSVITNITMQNLNGHYVNPDSGTAPQELPAYGLVDGGAENCEVINTVIRNIHSGINQRAAKTISSEDNPVGDTGAVSGISIGFQFLNGNCLNNIIYNLMSGNSSSDSGFVIGVDAWEEIDGFCSSNSMYNFISGNAGNNSGFTDGISISINGKAINILTLSGAMISLQSASCFDGCKLTLSALLVPMIFGSDTEEFLILFFVSDAKNPSQTKKFIGERIIQAGNFKVRLVPAPLVTFGI